MTACSEDKKDWPICGDYTLSFAPKQEELPCAYEILGCDEPLLLDCGKTLGAFPLAYRAYGTLSAQKDNAILICHPLTADQYVAETHPITGRAGWWANYVGPGKVIDTNKYFVICINVLGGCMGSAGPTSFWQQEQKIIATDFPVITIADMVRAQKLLIDALGIERLYAVIGGSMGAMQVLSWASLYPEKIGAAIPIAGSARQTAQNIAFHEVGRQAIMADPEWRGGSYMASGHKPTAGLAVARMAAHITYLSQEALHQKFGRDLQDRADLSYGFDADFKVESYLRHQGISFVDRFDANSYLYITRAVDYFDLAQGRANLAAAFSSRHPVHFCLIAFESDWLYPPQESRLIVHALNACALPVSYVVINSNKGHDAFLLDEPELRAVLAGFLSGLADKTRAGKEA